jgi:hypothetical protein
MTTHERISELLPVYLAKDLGKNTKTPYLLLEALGCYRPDFWNQSNWQTRTPHQPDEASEQLVVKTLIEALRIATFGPIGDYYRYSILSGLLRNNRWRTCLESVDSALHFTMAIACHYVGWDDADPAEDSLQGAIAKPLRTVVNEWLGVGSSNVARLTEMTILRAAFGEFWCDFALGPDMHFSDAAPIVLSTRPSFMPGVVSAAAVSLAPSYTDGPMVLPDLHQLCI